MAQKEKVAILGAGLGGLSTAYGLSATPELREQYDITIYQVGWRAGGQCATGRVGEQNRIDQNGTHYLFGCYDNMLSMSKEVYEELGAEGVRDFGSYDKSLLPRDLLAMKHFFRGKWELWPFPLPSNRAEPGAATGWLSPPDYLSMFLQAIVSLVFGIQIGRFLRPESPFGENRPAWLVGIYAILRPFVVVAGWILWAIGIFLFRLGQDLLWLFGDPDYLTVAKLFSGIRGLNRFLFGFLAQRFNWFFRIFTIGDFACTMMIGLIRDLVPSKGLGVIEPKEFRAWLQE
ncbi:MAG: NAD(P)-binding protein, partial [Pseudomonadota bacterium]